MSTSHDLHLEYLPLERLTRQTPAWWSGVLGVVGFESPPSLRQQGVPVTASMTPLLGSDQRLCEIWRVSGTLHDAPREQPASTGLVTYRHGDQWLFGCVRVDESDLADRDADGLGAAALRSATQLAYAQIFELLPSTGHPHLARVWNYVPDINAHSDGDERYRHFNSARQAAFARTGPAGVRGIPAASAVGSCSGSPLSIYFLAARHAPRAIENPRQVSAYEYPPRYGEQPPLFSRACVFDAAPGTSLFVSGTASIVGHESIHPGDVTAQTRETMTNIRTLVEQANDHITGRRYDMDGLKYKVYLRHRRDLAAVKAELSQWLKPGTSVVYLQADVCREDLLVEIEASGGAA